MIDLDATPDQASWNRWTLPDYKSDEFMKYLRENNMSISQFKESQLYRYAVDAGLIVDDNWVDIT